MHVGWGHADVVRATSHRANASLWPRRRRALSRGKARMIIAIDGPAASGKGTLGKRLAAHFGLRHLDTGLIYRAVAKALLDAGHPLDDAVRATAAAQALDPAQFDEKTLKGHAIGEAASIVSAIPEVRSALVAFQRDFAADAARRGARRARHRHRDLPRRRCEDLRHRGAGGARAPPRRRAAGMPASRPTKPRSSPTSCAATSATVRAPSRRSSRPRTRTSSTPRSSTSMRRWPRRSRSSSACAPVALIRSRRTTEPAAAQP